MESKEYNGWTNYETWAVNLWMDNERGTHDQWLETAKTWYHAADATSVLTKKQQAKIDLAEEIKRQHEEIMPELEGVFADLISAAMSEVNWYEIAENMVEAYMADHPEEFTEQTERD
jgi:hypothetical protein